MAHHLVDDDHWLSSGLSLGGKMMRVQVKNGQVRATPSFLGKIVANLHYGDQVTTLNSSGDWTEVSVGGVRGWMHKSALTTGNISLQAGGKDAPLAASNDELALAGKGFNEQVEASFKAKNPNLDYTSINRMEAVTTSAEERQRFLSEGGLTPKGSAR
jgi:uncharacterized protein YgiM (DUF1202 family)